ncbi:hypothetical protein UFOVP380_37 [uncultured Caudovirales phage]|uniref:Uncharacterized protein n=1 Tax=uncultured Caudovirales phage TaxID=2100421 RepID=A0A6J7X018_9CAUD|nr:hypothetical protein UFOVP380_37 [uncultured Caudovirales phage]
MPSKPTGRPVGRPKKELTDEQWATLIGMLKIQCTQTEICGIYDMDDDTLERNIRQRTVSDEAPDGLNFSQFQAIHANDGRASLRRVQWKAAQEGNVQMQIWLGKQPRWLGQTDKQEIDHTSGGQRISVNVNFDGPNG